MDGQELQKKRFTELHDRAFERGSYEYSDFLNLNEQSLLFSVYGGRGYSLDGGFDGAERVIACFGDEKEFYYPPSAPIVIIQISAKTPKFSDGFSHRDILGALMNLGIKREKLGDILVSSDNPTVGYLFCTESISAFICEHLQRIRHTVVFCCVIDRLPDLLLEPPVPNRVVVSSDRLDALVSAVFKLSRSESAGMISGGLVFISGRQVFSPDERISEGDVISVRGTGRFVFFGTCGQTKKGRLAVEVGIYK